MSDLSGLIDHVRDKADLEASKATPLYLRVQHGIEEAIRSGLVEVHEALPAERELAGSLGVSRVTVRNAVRALVDKGILVQRHGAGTFVASRVASPLRQLNSFTEDMLDRGLETSAHWLDRSTGLPTPEECDALSIEPDCPVSRLYRLRLADGAPICIEHAVLPRYILPEPLAIEESLYAWLGAHQKRPTRAVQTLSARLLDVAQAHLLNAPTGSPCLYVERRSFVPAYIIEETVEPTSLCARDKGLMDELEDRPIEFVRSHYRGDRYEFATELNI